MFFSNGKTWATPSPIEAPIGLSQKAIVRNVPDRRRFEKIQVNAWTTSWTAALPIRLPPACSFGPSPTEGANIRRTGAIGDRRGGLTRATQSGRIAPASARGRSTAPTHQLNGTFPFWSAPCQ